MAWKFSSERAVFLQIADRLRADIIGGRYPLGAQIPPVRQIASEAAVNPNTVQRAFGLLEEEGLIYTQGTVGRFVTLDAEAVERVRESAHRSAVRRLVRECRELGISQAELIKYFEEGDI
ncbi:MAG: GntR family transcriptional regulator [Ruminococcaceae bacterium]|nr:GntR family transcriptional regulator [Oscillospiraceae bacterium]